MLSTTLPPLDAYEQTARSTTAPVLCPASLRRTQLLAALEQAPIADELVQYLACFVVTGHVSLEALEEWWPRLAENVRHECRFDGTPAIDDDAQSAATNTIDPAYNDMTVQRTLSEMWDPPHSPPDTTAEATPPWLHPSPSSSENEPSVEAPLRQSDHQRMASLLMEDNDTDAPEAKRPRTVFSGPIGPLVFDTAEYWAYQRLKARIGRARHHLATT